MLTNNFDPVAFSIFSLDIRWYSLAYIFGIVLGWIYCKKFLIKDNNVLNVFDEYISYLIIGIILGGRLGYIIFYNPFYYLNNFLEIFMIWNGGMSFHGGLVGVLVSSYIFSNKYKLNNFQLLDLIALSAPIGIFLGRIANFINSELYGRPTDFFWSVKFINVDNIYRHPSQLYEAFFEGIVLFFLLNLLYKKYSNFFGITSSLFLIFYSFFRFFIEFTREADTQLGYFYFNLTMGQIISIAFFVFGLVLFYLKNETK